MLIIKIKNKINKEQLDLIVEYLLKGKVVVLPTDTVYGLSCIAIDKQAVDKIYKIKQRPKSMPLLVLVKSYCMLHDYFFVSKKQDNYIRTIWPRTTREAHDFSVKNNEKPTTFILNDRGTFANHLAGSGEGVGVRLPKDELLIKIINKVNTPLVSTSLNISGQKTNTNIEKLDKYFKISPDLVVDTGINREVKESKIIDIRDLENIRVIRE